MQLFLLAFTYGLCGFIDIFLDGIIINICIHFIGIFLLQPLNNLNFRSCLFPHEE